MTVKEIVRLWYETQHGHYLKCREAQIHFSDKMQKLHKKLKEKDELPEYQCFGDETL